MAEYIDRTQIKWYGCDHEGKACIPSDGHCEKCYFGTCNHDEVMNIPPADVAPVIHAHWIERIERDDYSDYEEEWLECSNCQYTDSERPHNFCPHCGAKMDEVFKHG